MSLVIERGTTLRAGCCQWPVVSRLTGKSGESQAG
jgi:hypothetical protein